MGRLSELTSDLKSAGLDRNSWGFLETQAQLTTARKGHEQRRVCVIHSHRLEANWVGIFGALSM